MRKRHKAARVLSFGLGTSGFANPGPPLQRAQKGDRPDEDEPGTSIKLAGPQADQSPTQISKTADANASPTEIKRTSQLTRTLVGRNKYLLF